jgi:hypothetical protein
MDSYDKHARPSGPLHCNEPASGAQAHKQSHFWQHAWSAVVIALLMLIPAHFHVFEPADHLIFNNITRFAHNKLNIRLSTYSATVLEIDQTLYDDFFSSTSPLPRAKLGPLLNNLFASKIFIRSDKTASSRPLIIDLDISPRGEMLDRFDEYFATEGEKECSSILASGFLTEHALCLAKEKNIPVVLLVPFPTEGEAVLKKYRWMRFICEHTSADFAFGDIPNADDITTPYYVNEETETQPKLLAHVARRYTSEPVSPKLGLCAEIKKNDLTESVPTAFAFLDRSIADIIARTDTVIPTLKSELQTDSPQTRLLDFSDEVGSIALSGVLCQSGTCSADDMGALERTLAAEKPGMPLLLGGTWDSGSADVFDIGAGRAAGVYLHAFALVDSFLTKVKHWTIALAEIPIGLMMIYIFSCLWETAGKKLHAIDDAISNHNTQAKEAWLSLLYLLALAAIPATGFILAFVVLSVVASLLSISIWVTPTGLLVSILLKTYMERNAGHEHRSVKDLYQHCYTRALAHLPLILLLSWATKIFIADFLGDHHA